MAYENMMVETRDAVGVITLDRPQALNALCAALIEELAQALDAFERRAHPLVTGPSGDEGVFFVGFGITVPVQMCCQT